MEKIFILSLKIDTTEPIELSAFVGSFTSLAADYRQFAKMSDLSSDEDAKIYVKEIRQGSIIADLIPVVAMAAPLAGQLMSEALAVEDFVTRWGGRLTSLSKGVYPGIANKKDLAQFMNTVGAISRDPDAKATLEAAEFIDGKKQILASFTFDTSQAKEIEKVIEAEYKVLDATEIRNSERVLMVFTRSDVSHAKIGKNSGERVKIEEISDRSLALTYASEMSEQRIKYEIQESPDNIFKKGFVVDVKVQENNGRPVAYSVAHVHDVIILPDDDNE